MENFTANGVILRETLYKESDKILKVLTAERGIISVYAKGVKNIKNKNSAAVQLFCYSELEITKSGGRYILKSAILKDSFFGIRNTVEKYALACYITDVVSALCVEESDETDTCRLLLNTLFMLSKSDDTKPLWQIKAGFELKLCSVLGFTPSMEYCALCDSKANIAEHNDSFKTNGFYMFLLAESSLICANCLESLSDTSVVMLTKETLLSALYILSSPIERFLSFKLSEEYALNFCDFCERYLLYTAERGFDTLKYYHSLSKENYER